MLSNRAQHRAATHLQVGHPFRIGHQGASRRFAQRRQRGHQLLQLVLAALPQHRQQDHHAAGGIAHLRRKERLNDELLLPRGVHVLVAPQLERPRGRLVVAASHVESDVEAGHLRLDGERPVGDLCGDAKVLVASAPHGPEQVRMAALARRHARPVGQHNLRAAADGGTGCEAQTACICERARQSLLASCQPATPALPAPLALASRLRMLSAPTPCCLACHPQPPPRE